MTKACHHCSKLQALYPEREYNPKSHIKQNCPILAETKCYNCGEIGHTPKYCKMPKIKCTHCGRIGHTVDLCTNEETNIVESENTEEIVNTNSKSWIVLNKKEMDFNIKN